MAYWVQPAITSAGADSAGPESLGLGVGCVCGIDQKSLLLVAGQACRRGPSTLSKSQMIAFQGDPLQMSQL